MATKNTSSTVNENPNDISKETDVKPTRKAKKKLELNSMVACTNLTAGKLVYISKKQLGYEVVWNNPGDVDYIELSELVSMRNSQRAFFEKNWIGIEDDDVIEYLNIGKYYNNSLSYEEFSNLLKLPFDTMSEKVKSMPKGMRENFRTKVAKMIDNNEIDSIKTVEFLKKELNIVVV